MRALLAVILLAGCATVQRRADPPEGARMAHWIPAQVVTKSLLSQASPPGGGGVTLTTTQMISGIKGFNADFGSFTTTSAGIYIGQHTLFNGIWFVGAGIGLNLTNFTILNAGDTIINSPAGQSTRLRVNNSNLLGCSSTLCTLTVPQAWPTGAAGSSGRAVLSGGTVTVSTTSVTASSVIQLTNCVTGGTAGLLRVSTLTAGTSFVITSASGTDTSTICWSFVN